MRKAEIVVRITVTVDQLAAIDRMVVAGEFGSRAALVNSIIREVAEDAIADLKAELVLSVLTDQDFTTHTLPRGRGCGCAPAANKAR